MLGAILNYFRAEDPSFTNKVNRRWSEQASDWIPWEFNHCMYCHFEVSPKEGQPTQQGGPLAASLTSLSPGVLSPSPLPCCQGCAAWRQRQFLRGEEAHRRAVGWLVNCGALRAGAIEQV